MYINILDCITPPLSISVTYHLNESKQSKPSFAGLFRKVSISTLPDKPARRRKRSASTAKCPGRRRYMS